MEHLNLKQMLAYPLDGPSIPLVAPEEVPPYPEMALEDICEQLLDGWGMTHGQIVNLFKDAPGYCAGMIRERACNRLSPGRGI